MTKQLSTQWKRLENLGGGGHKAPLPLFFPPLEAGETVGGGMDVVVGAHQDVVALQGVGVDLHNMEEGATTNAQRRGQR